MKQTSEQRELDTTSVIREAGYFGPQQDALFGWYHLPGQVALRATAVLICPPIGYEYVHSHRSLRHLADHLARLGFASLRFDYDGSGDSGGLNQDPQRVQAWLQSVREAITALKTQSGCARVCLFGLRMGAGFAGMIAAEQDVAALILWEPIVQGRRYVRELRALHLTATAHTGVALTESADIESAGFVISAGTAEELSGINLKNITPRTGNVLILQREDGPADRNLYDAWTAQGLHVDLLRYSGYADMMAETHFSIVPTAALMQISDWLQQHDQATKADGASPGLQKKLRLTANMSTRAYVQPAPEVVNSAPQITEHILRFGENNALFGIVSQPLTEQWRSLPTIILLNSGSVHHIGPHRLYVFLARQFAQMGFRVLRMDMSGIGDSVIADSALENHPYTQTATMDTDAAIGALTELQNDSGIVLMGLCSGAYASFHAGLKLADKNIVECLLINPLTFYWKEGMTLAIPSEQHYRQWSDYMSSMRKWDKWIKLLKGGVSIGEIIRTVAERIQILISVRFSRLKKRLSANSTGTKANDLTADLYALAERVKHITFVFSENDPGLDLLNTNAKSAVKRLKRSKKLSIRVVNDADHTFSRNAARNKLIRYLVQHFRHHSSAGF